MSETETLPDERSADWGVVADTIATAVWPLWKFDVERIDVGLVAQ